MKELIKDIEARYGISVLYASVTGSRLYNMHNENSDFDLRIVYVSLPWRRTLIVGQTTDSLGVPENTFRCEAEFLHEGKQVKVEVFGTEVLRFFNRLSGCGTQEFEAVFSPNVVVGSDLTAAFRKAATMMHNTKALHAALMSMAFGYLATKARNRDSLKNVRLSLRNYATALEVASNGFTVDTFANVQNRLEGLPIYANLSEQAECKERTAEVYEFLVNSPVVYLTEPPKLHASHNAVKFTNQLLAKVTFAALQKHKL